ncbi:9763_t:CDS:2 [Paraglomus occultum]|uniref:Uroporphyrinogen-III synthase n=1 Tax=Paraglomus occultum TaxID=144539 RepID=A0A9N9GTS5_9GLOM|nr:9763_t:CDS:2 [Paraglomus occultum]
MQSILLLKDKSRNDNPNNTAYMDPYEKELSMINCSSVFVPVLEHALLNIPRLSDLLKEGSKSKYWGAIVTSQRAVEALRTAWNEVVSELTADTIMRWKNIPFFVVGKATARAVSELNFTPVGAEHSGNADLLADYIVSYYAQNKLDLENQSTKLLFLVGDKRRDAIPKRMLREGIGVDELLVYETRPNEQFEALLKDALDNGRPFDWVVFFSPSGVDITIECLRKWKVIPNAKLATIGPTTAHHLQGRVQIRVNAVAEKPDAASLAKAIDGCIR